MKFRNSGVEIKSVEMLAFEIYLRTGRRIPHAEIRLGLERKFNIWHDPGNGQFTFAQGGVAGSGLTEARGKQNPVITRENAKPARPRSAAGHADGPNGWREGGVMHAKEIEQRANHAMPQFYDNIARGMPVDDAAAWAANSEVESRGNPAAVQDGGGPGRGYFQLGAPIAKLDRRLLFQKVMGVSIEHATLDQQLKFKDWELGHTEKGAKKKIDSANGAGAKAYAISLYFLRPGAKVKAAIDRANLAEAILRRNSPGAPSKSPKSGVRSILPKPMH